MQGSPSENINSADANERMTVRFASDANSASLSAENRAVPFKTSAVEGSLSVLRKSRLGGQGITTPTLATSVAAPRIALSSLAYGVSLDVDT